MRLQNDLRRVNALSNQTLNLFCTDGHCDRYACDSSVSAACDRSAANLFLYRVVYGDIITCSLCLLRWIYSSSVLLDGSVASCLMAAVSRGASSFSIMCCNIFGALFVPRFTVLPAAWLFRSSVPSGVYIHVVLDPSHVLPCC